MALVPENLSGKLVLLTGASGGTGKAVALRLSRPSVSPKFLALHYNSPSSLSEVIQPLISTITAQNPNVQIEAFQGDLSTYEGARKLVRDIGERFGDKGVDVALLNHGLTRKVVGAEGDIQDVSAEDFEETWRANCGTHFEIAKLLIPSMIVANYGRIVFTGSIAGTIGGTVGPHYASSKSALHGLSAFIASRYAKNGITSNVILPSLIKDTKMLPIPKDGMEGLKRRIPIGRLGAPDEVASVVEMLVLNGFMTNKIIPVDGGLIPSG